MSLLLLGLSLLCATIQHGVYASVYLSSRVRVFLAKNHPGFVAFAYALKGLTLALYGLYISQAYGLFSVTFNAFAVAGALLFGYGFWLNSLVTALLGTTGIYYGYEMGLVPPGKKVTAFPYSIHKDPQYLGCILQYIGTALIFGLDPVTFALRTELWVAAAYLSGLYFYTLEIEKLPLAQ
ncbi:UNVERIFIED_CONTAM: hypothetical protein HDU68_008658 [Siphonaria sp. JEL0065]|nr:hypothetical protein HDU68_008658 [Siphonaria sp. JEL0065]